AEALEQKIDGTEVTIIDGGKEFHFVMEDDFDTILDGALAAGADLPFACKGGVCSTCKCKVVEGEVKMKVNYALEEDEVAKDFVLSCQAVPTTKKVVVDFDV
ncbi:MAG TPA: 2Fe-2S iron-sulfur cluster binding domain-containing protein, partial [Oceanospirillales bacterium]|nr:2Fe-2S iron-sulfur cluster binding domain-containing protein [Oceanospirillales bacterium]